MKQKKMLEVTDEQRRNILLTEEDILAAEKKFPLADTSWKFVFALALIAVIIFLVGILSIV